MISSDWTYNDIPYFADRVRGVLNGVSEVTLTNDAIKSPEKAEFAEMLVKARVPNWQQIEDDKIKFLESAIVYKTASFFQAFVNNRTVKKKAIPTITLQYNDTTSFDVDGFSLDEMASWYISLLLGEDEKEPSRFMFRVTDSPSKKCTIKH